VSAVIPATPTLDRAHDLQQVPDNLFADLPDSLVEELTTVLARSPQVRIERIVSRGQCSPEGFWYDQDEAEWVVVLRGSAKLLVEGAPDPLHMSAGDHLLIPAHSKHRVEWTTPDEPTIWLAVFFADEPSRADL
jgi:cupin 2 domain-containing protein